MSCDPGGPPQGPRGDSSDPFGLACRYLTARERSSGQVRDHLKRKGFSETEITGCIDRLMERRLLDDLRYARTYVASRSRRSPRSGAFLVRELVLRGVDRETAGRAVSEYLAQVPEEELAGRVASKLAATGPVSREKLVRRLRSRGFRGGAALRVRGEEATDPSETDGGPDPGGEDRAGP